MDFVSEMLRTSPGKPVIEGSTLAECIRACLACEQSCIACADACLGEDQVQMLAACIRLNLDCADLCTTSVRLLTRQQHAVPLLLRAQVEAMSLACRMCAEECERHQDKHEHCRVCAEACRKCEEACQTLLKSLPTGPTSGAARAH